MEYQRKSLEYRHQDLQLGPHTPHMKDVGKMIKPRESEKPKLQNMTALYSEGHELTCALDSSHFREAPSNNESLRPSQVSDTYQKKKINYLKQKSINHKREIELLRV